MLDRLIESWREFLDLIRFGIILHAYEQGVVLRWGNHHRTIGPGGFHWHWPLKVEQVLHHSIVADCVVMSEQSLTTKDGKDVTLTPVTTFEVDDIVALLLGVTTLEAALADAVTGAVSTLVVRHDWAAVTGEEFANDVSKKARARGKKHGLRIVEVQFRDVTRGKTIRLLQGKPNKEHDHA